MWKSILTAQGFRGDFKKIWLKRVTQLPNVVDVLPDELPTSEVAVGLFTAFLTEYRQLEKILRAEQRLSAKQRRKDNPHQIFVAKPRPLPVQTLVTTHALLLFKTSVRKKQCTVEPSILEGIPIHSRSGLVDCRISSPTQITFEDGNPVEVGSALTQEKLIGSRKEVFDAFEDLWTKWWGTGKHRTADDEAWMPFADMCDQVPNIQSNNALSPNCSARLG